MCRVGPPQIVNGNVSKPRRYASCFPTSPEGHLRNRKHALISGDSAAHLPCEDVTHSARGEDHPRFAALAVPYIDHDPIGSEWASVVPGESLYLTLSHAGMDSPEDEVHQPFSFKVSHGKQRDQFLVGEEPLTGNSTPDRIGILCRRF